MFEQGLDNSSGKPRASSWSSADGGGGGYGYGAGSFGAAPQSANGGTGTLNKFFS